MKAVRDATLDYFRSIDLAFDALDRIFETEGIWVKRHNLIYHLVTGHLRHLRRAFQCWQHRIWFMDSFKVDTAESGFPLFQNVLELRQDAIRARERLEDLPETDLIREEMIELLLKFKQYPDALQKTMAERLYFETVERGGLFGAVSRLETIRHSYNPRGKRPYYVVHWSAYDGTANLPMIYQAVIEDSSSDAPMPPERRQGPWGETDAVEPLPGLPNEKLTAPFRAFVENHSGYSLTLTSIATAMDKDFPNLHPKQLRRFVLGPVYIGGMTDHNDRVRKLLTSGPAIHENWILTWTIQELHSQESIPAKRGLWGGTPQKEIYYINTDDVDCAQQGVSALDRHALLPHPVYQAAYAEGVAEEILRGHHVYIASGDHILRHV